MLPNIIKSILVLILGIKPHTGNGNLFNILVFWTRNMAQTSLDLFEWRKRVLGWSRSFNLKLGETVSCDVRL